MVVSLSIKNVPDDVVERLRERAKRNHRSMQGELITILEEAIGPEKITLAEAVRRTKELGLKTEGDSTAMIREGRDSGRVTLRDLTARARELGLETDDDAVWMIREDRDAR